MSQLIPKEWCGLPRLGAQPVSFGSPELAGGSTSTRPHRIVLYSHDTQGLGHMRRNLLLATALLTLSPRPNILLIGGARELGALSIPDGIDCLTLPALHKHGDGSYQPRSLSISLRRIIKLRTGAIEAAIASFEPDLLIVDKVPLGAFGELEPALAWLRSGGRARCVLGLREILDEPEVARREWDKTGSGDAVKAYYDQIWVYGDPAVYDLAHEYRLEPEVAEKIVYTGYLDRGAYHPPDADTIAEVSATLDLPPEARVALCCVGGGQDGAELARAFARATLPDDMVGVILTGPFMPPAERSRLQRMVAQRPQLRLATFLEEPAPLLHRADAVVAMAGYNTVCEVLSLGKRALLVPRVRPRREQLIRAKRLDELGMVKMLHPRRLTAAALSDWLAASGSEQYDLRPRIDFGALERVPALAARLIRREQAFKEIARAS